MTQTPVNLFARTRHCLALASASGKTAQTRRLYADCLAGGYLRDILEDPSPASAPGRPARPLLVPPARVPRRRLGSPEGRAALVHAIAHIEFNAINLALDAVYRFRDMPDQYYLDWLSVAADESRHFGMLSTRLQQLGHAYGDFPAHDGLWQMAVQTSHDCMVRMALVPRVLEARGLDVTPGMIERLQAVGDQETVSILSVILEEEIGHVEIGSRWFAWCCRQRGLEPEATFIGLMLEYYGNRASGPLNREARLRAGFADTEIDRLEALAGAKAAP